VGSDGSFDRVKAAGKLVIAIDDQYAPMEFENKDGQLTGFDHDLALEVAKRLGVPAEFKRVHWEWPDVPKGLMDRQCDMSISAWNITEERKQEAAFVQYWHSHSVFACRRGVSVKDERDLADKRVAVYGGTLQHKYLTDLEKKGTVFKKLIVLKAGDNPFPLLKKSEADVVIADAPVGRYQAKLDPDITITGTIGQETPPAIGMVFHPKDEQLRQGVESAFQSIQRDGTFARIYEKWFGQ
jgi:polar amino acid transport system substrate-binding protein